jgi:putative ABC transport system permease protein
MAHRSEWWRRLRALWRGRSIERQLDEEIQFHLDRETDKNIAAGMDPERARRAAVVRFGGVEPVKERTRDEFRPALIQDFLRDLRMSVRMLRRTPGFAATTILTIGLGTGAATAVFSVVENVLLRPLPYPQADRIVRLYQLRDTGARGSVSDLNFADWQARTHSFAAMAEMGPWGSVPVIGGAEPTMASATLVSKDFFEVMRVRPAIGRAFSPGEQRLGGQPAAVVSHSFWRQVLGGADAIREQAVRIGGRLYAIVGVMPAGFDYPNGTAVWLARELNPLDTSRTAHNFQAIGRVKDDVSLETAQAELSQVSRQMKAQYGADTWMVDAATVPLLEQLTAASKPALQILFGAALVLLLVACTNVSSLLLARAAARRHEFAIQLAIGAGRLRILRQLLAETLVLATAGGIVGIVVAMWAVKALIGLGPGTAPRLDQTRVDWVSLAFGLGVSTTAALVLGVLTTVGARDLQLSSVLSDGPRTGTDGRRGLIARQALVVAQVALTFGWLHATGLLGRSFVRLLAVEPGYRLDDALVVDLTVADGGSDYRVRRVALLDALLDRVRTLPGVSSAGLITGFPLGGGNYSNGRFLEMTSLDEIRGEADVAKLGPAAQQRAGQAGFRITSDGYFQAMGIPLLRGRFLERSDGPDATHVAVISQSLAESKWPGQDPIDRFVQFGNMDGDPHGFRIVGVVGDVRELTLESAPGPLFYVSYRQRPNSLWRVSAIVRGPDPQSLVSVVRRTIRDLNPELPIELRTINEAFDRALTGRRFSLVLLTMFGAAALVLATLGLYGLISYIVAQRTREIGIRMALGADAGDLIRLIVGKGAAFAAIGSLIGIVAALALTGVLRGQVFGITASDPAVLSSVVVLTIVCAVAASYLPARRVSRIAPVASLR